MAWLAIVCLLAVTTALCVRMAALAPGVYGPAVCGGRSGGGGRGPPRHVMVFLGSGGHTGEMLRLLEVYGAALVAGATVRVGYTDEASAARGRQSVALRAARSVEYVPLLKAREVGAGAGAAVRSTLRAAAQAFGAVRRARRALQAGPHVVVLNGPGTSVVVLFWLRVLDLVSLRRTRVVYVESLARTESLSVSGRLAYPFADEFVVQWPDLAQRYRRARWFGTLV
ncbi:AaceriAGL202Wp [[Ashbya] aceris (nom. inval.)]|nr:AaceriAGL202Wp [[Ashbya] aceris (nom. inval.)]